MSRPRIRGQRFLFVMTETTEGPELSAQANQEIQAWFADLIDQGVLEVETAVGNREPLIGAPPDGPLLSGPVSGMVVIRATNEQHARQHRCVVADHHAMEAS